MTEIEKVSKAPELYSKEDAVPLGYGEKAMVLKIRVTLDGGYDENHFYVPVGRSFPVRDIDIRSGVEVGLSKAWVNSRIYEDYLNETTEKKQ